MGQHFSRLPHLAQILLTPTYAAFPKSSVPNSVPGTRGAWEGLWVGGASTSSFRASMSSWKPAEARAYSPLSGGWGDSH